MSTEPLPAPGGIKKAVGRARSVALSFQRIVVLGFAALVLGTVVSRVLALHVFSPILEWANLTPGTGTQILAGVLNQVGLLLALPALAWAVGWLVDEPALRLCLGAALFGELWMVAVSYLTGGVEAVVADPVYLGTRLLAMGAAALLGVLAYRDARRRLDTRPGRRRAPEPTAEPANNEVHWSERAPLLPPELEVDAKDDEVEPIGD